LKYLFKDTESEVINWNRNRANYPFELCIPLKSHKTVVGHCMLWSDGPFQYNWAGMDQN